MTFFRFFFSCLRTVSTQLYCHHPGSKWLQSSHSHCGSPLPIIYAQNHSINVFSVPLHQSVAQLWITAYAMPVNPNRTMVTEPAAPSQPEGVCKIYISSCGQFCLKFSSGFSSCVKQMPKSSPWPRCTLALPLDRCPKPLLSPLCILTWLLNPTFQSPGLVKSPS